MGRGLNINVNALLPGGNWSSKMKSKQSSEQVTPDEKQVVESADVKESQDNQDNHEQSTGLLNNVAKVIFIEIIVSCSLVSAILKILKLGE